MMKTRFPDFPTAMRLTIWWAFGLLATVELRAGPGPAPATGEPKHYIMFAGADILADFDGKSHQVIGASGASLELLSETKTEVVPAKRVTRLRTIRGVKLSTLTANIGRIRSESLRIAFNGAQAAESFDSDTATREEQTRVAVEKALAGRGNNAFGPNATDWAANREQQMSAVDQRESNIANVREILDDAAIKRSVNRDTGDRNAAAKPTDELPPLPFRYDYDPEADGLAVRCELSSPHPLEKAYLAVTIRYVDSSAAHRNLQRVEIEPVPRVDEKPRKATVSLRGLPRGFRLTGCEVDLYANGQEVTTNLSGKQTPMTEEQVYQYYLSAHLSLNRGKSRPPVPLLMAPPNEVRRQIDRAVIAQEVYAQVGKQGNLVSLSMAGDKVIEVTPQIQAVMRFVRFFPGLENGQPAEGRVKFKPADLLQ